MQGAGARASDEPTAVRFGRYDAIQTLGTGGMATVFLALLRGDRPETHRLVALKQSHAGISRSAQWKEALREAHCGTSIRHPNVVSVLEVGDGAQGPYIVMEYVEGGSLLALLTESQSDGRAKRLPPAVACRAIVDSLRGLHAAHEARDPAGSPLGLVHSDVSPHNLLVGTDGITRLADFGIARFVQLSNSAPGVLRGKVGYVAPEQAAGRAPDRRSDIFSMGVVMWEIFTGRRLFKGANVDESLRRLVFQAAPALHEVLPEVPRSISDLCAWALSKASGERPATAALLADQLELRAREHGILASHADVAAEVVARLREKLVRRHDLLQHWLTAAGFSAETVTSRLLTSQSGTLRSAVLGVPTPEPSQPAEPPMASSAVRRRATHPELTRVPSGHDWVAFVPSRSSGVGAPPSSAKAPVAPRSPLRWVAFAVLCVAAAGGLGYVCADRSRVADWFANRVAAISGRR